MKKVTLQDLTAKPEIEVNYPEMFTKCFVDVKAKLPPPPVALSIGEHTTKSGTYPIPFGTYGNFSCLVGASKSMKTFLKSALIASYIGGDTQTFFPNMKGHNNTGKYVIDVDTEQSLWHTQAVARRICDMVGSDYSLFIP